MPGTFCFFTGNVCGFTLPKDEKLPRKMQPLHFSRQLWPVRRVFLTKNTDRPSLLRRAPRTPGRHEKQVSSRDTVTRGISVDGKAKKPGQPLFLPHLPCMCYTSPGLWLWRFHNVHTFSLLTAQKNVRIGDKAQHLQESELLVE